MNPTTISKSTVTVDVDTVKLAAIDVRGSELVQLLVRNTGLVPLSSFVIEGKVTRYNNNTQTPEGADDEYIELKATGYDEPDFYLINATSDPTILTAGGAVLLTINTSLLDYVRIKVKAAGAPTTVVLQGSCWSD